MLLEQPAARLRRVLNNQRHVCGRDRRWHLRGAVHARLDRASSAYEQHGMCCSHDRPAPRPPSHHRLRSRFAQSMHPHPTQDTQKGRRDARAGSRRKPSDRARDAPTVGTMPSAVLQTSSMALRHQQVPHWHHHAGPGADAGAARAVQGVARCQLPDGNGVWSPIPTARPQAKRAACLSA